jgi:hypothetical protein
MNCVTSGVGGGERGGGDTAGTLAGGGLLTYGVSTPQYILR